MNTPTITETTVTASYLRVGDLFALSEPHVLLGAPPRTVLHLAAKSDEPDGDGDYRVQVTYGDNQSQRGYLNQGMTVLRVTLDGAAAETATATELRDIEAGSWVSRDHGATRFMVTGSTVRRSGDSQYSLVLVAADGSYTMARGDSTEYQPIGDRLDSGDPQRITLSQVGLLARRYELGRDTAGHYERRIDAMREDFQRVNEHMNSYADEVSWCGDYEDIHLRDLNNLLRSGEFEFTGRERDFEVDVTVTITYSGSVSVTAGNLDAAREMVDEMSTSDVVGSLGGISHIYQHSDDSHETE